MRIEQLTFSRFIAAISIVIYHYGINVYPFNLKITSFLFEQANIGVSYFFLLSGFVMIIAYGRKPKVLALRYLKNRIARIYPVYLLAIFTLLAYLLFSSYKIDRSGFFLNILLIQSWIPGKALSFNSPGWSLGVELLFYLIFPFLYNRVYNKFSYNKLIGPFAIIWLTTQIIFHWYLFSNLNVGFGSKINEIFYYFPLMHINEFLIGNLAALYYLDRLKLKRINYDWLIVIIIITVTILLRYNFGLNYHNGLLAVLFIPLILLMSINNGILTKFSNYKVFVFLGEISYGIYILQVPVYTWMEGIYHSIGIEHHAIRFYLSLIILIIIASISYVYFETPLRIQIRNINLYQPK